MKTEVSDNWNVWALGIVEVDILESDFAYKAFQPEALKTLRANGLNTIDGFPEFCGSTLIMPNSFINSQNRI